ncbi:unnamed protein product, partial [marine sediment metagenome]
MTIDDLIGFLKKKGFRDTLEVLMNSKGHKIDKHAFYSELNKFSYYNSYFRVKEDLIERGLITIEQNNKKKYVKLTSKGLDVYNKLVEINNLIKFSQECLIQFDKALVIDLHGFTRPYKTYPDVIFGHIFG